MGIFCQINLYKPADTTFKPGETISGLIKYAIHEPMEFDRITTSLKGKGKLKVKVKGNKNKKTAYNANENYVDIDDIVAATKVNIPVGCYEIKFNFKIPERIPSSLDYNKTLPHHIVKCKIKYYIRIKFERPGWFTLSKHFRKEIKVVSGITPQLLTEPVVYGESKKLLRLFSRKHSVVGLKATIINSVVQAGGTLQVNYEVNNDTNIVIKSVESKIIEIYTFKAPAHTEVTICEEVPNTITKTGNIHCGVIKSWPLTISMSLDRVSLQYSKIVARDYIVRIIVDLPLPHKNLVLDIPVQIGYHVIPGVVLPSSSIPASAPELTTSSLMSHEDPPPPYWEVMGKAMNNDTFHDQFVASTDNSGEKFTQA